MRYVLQNVHSLAPVGSLKRDTDVGVKKPPFGWRVMDMKTGQPIFAGGKRPCKIAKAEAERLWEIEQARGRRGKLEIELWQGYNADKLRKFRRWKTACGTRYAVRRVHGRGEVRREVVKITSGAAPTGKIEIRPLAEIGLDLSAWLSRK